MRFNCVCNQSCHRGLSVERTESEVGSKGRAVHMKDSSATGASSLHSGSAASEPLVAPLAHMVSTNMYEGEIFLIIHFQSVLKIETFQLL